MVIKNGWEKGLDEGFKQGIEQGIEQGKKNEKLEIAKIMLKEGIDIKIIEKVINLSVKELQELV